MSREGRSTFHRVFPLACELFVQATCQEWGVPITTGRAGSFSQCSWVRGPPGRSGRVGGRVLAPFLTLAQGTRVPLVQGHLPLVLGCVRGFTLREDTRGFLLSPEQEKQLITPR